jgi:hypothetical protein
MAYMQGARSEALISVAEPGCSARFKNWVPVLQALLTLSRSVELVMGRGVTFDGEAQRLVTVALRGDAAPFSESGCWRAFRRIRLFLCINHYAFSQPVVGEHTFASRTTSTTRIPVRTSTRRFAPAIRSIGASSRRPRR